MLDTMSPKITIIDVYRLLFHVGKYQRFFIIASVYAEIEGSIITAPEKTVFQIQLKLLRARQSQS